MDITETEISFPQKKCFGHKAIAFLQKATTIEEKLPTPSGPPRIIKPTYELLGEILLSMGKPKEAAQQFATSLSRHPNRARSILGAARASANQGNKKEARRKYLQFLTIWKHADQNLPELHESRNYLEQK